ncbi:hypothetical protein [Comamonas sp. E6]|uniref:phage head spike fiber domain-containing protein n=1 Tax=Comamonas sp. E6 TaxID=364029 RepID=UPI000633D68E|nr:hypothetical protein [Comamonas sp. E6]GAO72666.1 hypothetical protein CSE6_025_41030 [Comamonas sp. E6]
MSTVDNFPDLRPNLLLDFANSGRVDPRIQCARASTATCYGSDGKLRTVLANVPRIDHDPLTGKCLGLLLEEARTNLLSYSSKFENVIWTKGNATFTPNASLAPDGSLTAGKLAETTANAIHNLYATVAPTAGAVAFSFFVKAAGRSLIRLTAYEASVPSNPVSAYFDLAAKSVLSSGGLSTSASIMDVGGGWLRCSVSGMSAGTSTTWQLALQTSPDASAYIGDGISGAFIWGAQLESGTASSSYIPTEAATATRAADVAALQYPTSGDIGTMLIHARLDASGVNVFFPLRARGEVNAYKGVPYCLNSNVTVRSGYVRANGQAPVVAVAPGTNVPRMQPYKSALSWSNRQFRTATNGSASADVTYDYDIPAGTHLDFCATSPASAVSGLSHIYQVSVYSASLSAAVLQRLTQL